MMGKEAKTILFVLLVVSLLTIGMTDDNTVYAQNAEDIDKYSKNYINRMFTELEPVMVFDEDKHLSLNHTAAEYYGFSPYDIRFGEEYVTVHNSLMDTVVTGGNITEALLPITEGKFSAVFDETKRVKRGYFDSTACGSHNFKNPHTSYKYNIVTGMPIQSMKNSLTSQGYGLLTLISASPWIDSSYQKISTTYTDCNGGEMRDEITLVDANSVQDNRYKWQPNEPNPNLTQYNAPTYWWNAYTLYWHVIYNEFKENISTCPPITKTQPISGNHTFSVTC